MNRRSSPVERSGLGARSWREPIVSGPGLYGLVTHSAGVWISTIFIQLTPIPSTTASAALNEGAAAAAGEELLEGYLDEFHSLAQEVIGRYGGERKVLAPASVLALFVADEPAGHAERSVRAAVELMEELASLGYQRPGRRPFRTGIGVHSDHLADSSALDGSVTQAEELSRLNMQTPFPAVFISQNALNGLSYRNGYYVAELGQAPQPSELNETPIYALLHTNWTPAAG